MRRPTGTCRDGKENWRVLIRLSKDISRGAIVPLLARRKVSDKILALDHKLKAGEKFRARNAYREIVSGCDVCPILLHFNNVGRRHELTPQGKQCLRSDRRYALEDTTGSINSI